jgi:hypothetical protein
VTVLNAKTERPEKRLHRSQGEGDGFRDTRILSLPVRRSRAMGISSQRLLLLVPAAPRNGARGRIPPRSIGGLTMRKEQEGSRRIDRRRLLTGAGLAVGAAGASSALAAKPAVAAAAESEPQHKGYRESELVKTYYKLARF